MANRLSKQDRDDERQRNRGDEGERGTRFYVNRQSELDQSEEHPRYVQQTDRDPGRERGSWGDDQRFRTSAERDPNEEYRDRNERENTRTEYGRYGESAPRIWSDPRYRDESERHEREQRHWSEQGNRDAGYQRDREHNRGQEKRWTARTPDREWAEAQSRNWREWQDRDRSNERNWESRNVDWQSRERERDSYNRDWNRERNEARNREGYGIRERITRNPDVDWRERNEGRDESLTERVGRFIGIGPKGYRRSDERIREDVSERLEDHPDINAAEIEVTVKDGEVTLTGNVDNRLSKRLAEDEAAHCRGVKDVHNNIRVVSERGGTAA
jgi:hypothetical protein